MLSRLMQGRFAGKIGVAGAPGGFRLRTGSLRRRYGGLVSTCWVLTAAVDRPDLGERVVLRCSSLTANGCDADEM